MISEMTDPDFYAEPSNQAVSGPGVRRKRPGLSTHVPVRFAPDTILAVKAIADRDHLSVSTWIRNVVTREVERRMPPHTGTDYTVPTSIDEAPAKTASVGTRDLVSNFA